MHFYVNNYITQEQSKKAIIKAARERYIAAKIEGKVKASLSAEEAQKRAQQSVFRLS